MGVVFRQTDEVDPLVPNAGEVFWIVAFLVPPAGLIAFVALWVSTRRRRQQQQQQERR